MAVPLSKLLQRFWTDSMTVFTAVSSVDAETGLTEQTWTVLTENAPCKLSFSGSGGFTAVSSAALASAAGDPVAEPEQGVRLYCAPELQIPPGSRITVIRPAPGDLLGKLVLGRRGLASGIVLQYRSSGLPAIFSAHQEIRVETAEAYT